MKKSILLFFVIFSIIPLQAQRYLPGQWGAQVSGGFIDGFNLFKKNDRFGYHLNLSFSRYTEDRNRWMYGVNFTKEYYQEETHLYPVNQYVADVSFWFPFVSDRGKNIFLSAGVGLSSGYEHISYVMNTAPKKTLQRKNQNDKFLYGGFIGLEMELFLTNRWIFLINARERYLRGSPFGNFQFNLGAGIKYILNY